MPADLTSPRDFSARLLRLTGPKPRIALAFSGGVDSTVLATSLVAARRRLGSLRLLHVDHGLQPASAEWASHCTRQARRWRVPIRVLRAKVIVRRGESPEAVAREARYALFERELAPGEFLVTAHHLDDQVETFFLQLCRGAGVSGLAAMPALRRFASGWIARPLLEVSRADLVDHARGRHLQWIEDPSNAVTRFGRNFLRHEVLPILRQRWPGFDVTVARTAAHMAEAALLLEARASADLVTVADGSGLNVAALRRLPAARRRNVLRSFITRGGFELPSTAKMREIAGALLTARADAQPSVAWPGAILCRRAGRLELQVMTEVAAESQAETVQKSWRWADDRAFVLNSADELLLVDDERGPIDLDRLPRVLELRPRQGGESLRPGPHAPTKSLKKLLQAARFTLEQRAKLPLLFAAGPRGRLVAAGDRWFDASIAANVKSRRRARLVWRRAR